MDATILSVLILLIGGCQMLRIALRETLVIPVGEECYMEPPLVPDNDNVMPPVKIGTVGQRSLS